MPRTCSIYNDTWTEIIKNEKNIRSRCSKKHVIRARIRENNAANLPLARKASNNCWRILMILSAIAFSSRVHSRYMFLQKISDLFCRTMTKHNFWTYTGFYHIERKEMAFLGSQEAISWWLIYYLSLRIVATIDAPWMGGLEYIGLITNFSWLSTLLATSAFLQTYRFEKIWRIITVSRV